MGHKPAYLSPPPGGMSVMPAIVSDFAAMQRRKCSAINDITSIYSMTSSAMACSVNGTARPSALAVLRFRTISNFVGS